MLTEQELDAQIAKWVATAPARESLRIAREELRKAASVFYLNGFKELGDQYAAIARQIQKQG